MTKAWEDREALKTAEAARKASELAALGIDLGLRDMLDSPNGRDALWWLLGIAGVGALPVASTDRDTMFKLGELNVGQQLLEKIISLDPHAYVQMQLEHLNARSTPEPAAEPDTSFDSLPYTYPESIADPGA